MSDVDAIEFREIVRGRTNIVELIGESVSLATRRGGSEFVGLCPFHDDHNPSMCVYPDRQSYRCWVCEAGGDAFSFVMKHENVSFPEAIKLLADRAGLEMPRKSSASPRSGPDKPRLLEVLAWADRQFRMTLAKSPAAGPARDYLSSRGVSAAMIEQFGLGYHPPEWQWLLQRAQGNCTAQELAAVDLARERRDGSGLIDAFVGRILFPIRDERGRVVAFGGRVLPGQDESASPKYLNSGDTPVFSKSKLVYGLDIAREEIRRTGIAIVTEGYTDCIAAHQAGYRNAVATLGTALAESHVALLKRYARTVVLVFDGDDAGRNAAERALARFLAQDVDLRILTLPSGLDPADYFAKDDQEGFGERIASAPEALEFKLMAAVDRFGVDTVDGRDRVAKDVLGTLGAAPRLAGSVREGILLRRIADRLSVPESILRDELGKLRRIGPTRRPSVPDPQHQSTHSEPTALADHAAERELLAMIITQPALFDVIARHVGSDDFVTPRLRTIFEYCRDVADYHGIPAYDLLMSNTVDSDLKQLIVGLDIDARRRGVAESVDSWDPGGAGTDAAIDETLELPPLVAAVVRKLVDRRELSEWQASCGQFVRRHAGETLDATARDQLRRLQQQLASKHL